MPPAKQEAPKPVRRRLTFREAFVKELKALGGADQKLVNSKVLREKLKWDDDRYKRVRAQLLEENAIVVARGGPGGQVGLANIKNEKALSVFISYCHADEDLKNELIKHLTPLKRLNLVSEWNDRKIIPGQLWGEEISKNLEAASLILLLVSADFINSEYCYDVEMDRALERHDSKEAVVIPVLLRSCMWQHAPFAKVQALPRDMKAVSGWADKDEAFVNIAEGVKAAAEAMLLTVE